MTRSQIMIAMRRSTVWPAKASIWSTHRPARSQGNRASRASWRPRGGVLIRGEHGAVVVGRNLDKPRRPQASRLDRRDGLVWRHTQFGPRPARLAQDGGFLTRSLMPVHDGEAAGGPENLRHRAREARLVRYAMKGVRHENEIDLVRP